MICTRPGALCLVVSLSLGLLVSGRANSAARGPLPVSSSSSAELDPLPVSPEDDPREPVATIVSRPERAFGAGECPQGIELELWPPNHKYVEIDLEDVLGPQTSGISILSITQDEPVEGLGDGNTQCDGDGVGTSVARIRAERSGLENGRVYEIEYSAFGGGCTGFVTVTVPHDRRGDAAEDDGQDFDSTEGCP